MNEIQEQLQVYYVAKYQDWTNVRVEGLVNLNSGWESDVSAFDLTYELDSRYYKKPLILRIYPGDDAREKAKREFEGMRALHQVGYPVPQVFILEEEASPFGKPFLIMERIDGQSMWRKISKASEEDKILYLEQFCRLFLQLHNLDWHILGNTQAVEGGGAYFFVDSYLDLTRFYLERFQLSGFLPVLDWLRIRRNRVPCDRPSLTHWDFHPENILLTSDDVAYVIDWTSIQVCDWRFDLAWTLLLMGSYEGDEVRQIILSEYERQAGAQIEELEFFDVYACIRRLGSVLISIRSGPEKLGMRPGSEEIMLRQLPALARVYQLMMERTGIAVPEIELLFNEKGINQ